MEIVLYFLATILTIGVGHISNNVNKANDEAANGKLNANGFYNEIRNTIDQLRTIDSAKYEELNQRLNAIPFNAFSDYVTNLYRDHRKSIVKRLKSIASNMRANESRAAQLENSLYTLQNDPDNKALLANVKAANEYAKQSLKGSENKKDSSDKTVAQDESKESDLAKLWGQGPSIAKDKSSKQNNNNNNNNLTEVERQV